MRARGDNATWVRVHCWVTGRGRTQTIADGALPIRVRPRSSASESGDPELLLWIVRVRSQPCVMFRRSNVMSAGHDLRIGYIPF